MTEINRLNLSNIKNGVKEAWTSNLRDWIKNEWRVQSFQGTFVETSNISAQKIYLLYILFILSSEYIKF